MVEILVIVGAAAGGSGLTLLIQRIVARRASTNAAAESDDPPEQAAVERWNAETVRISYEHARDLERTLDAWADQIDSKAATIYSVGSIIAGLASSVGLTTAAGVPRLLWLAALMAWGLSALACWMAFKPRDYSLHPNLLGMITAKVLGLEPGPFYLRRLRQTVRSYRRNTPQLERKAKALAWAVRLATVEILLLLAALWLAKAPKS